jgi:subtilisin-like proprotein convertase family protein
MSRPTPSALLALEGLEDRLLLNAQLGTLPLQPPAESVQHRTAPAPVQVHPAAAQLAVPHVVQATTLASAPGSLDAVRLTFDRAINPGSLSPAHVHLTGPYGQAVPVTSVSAVAGTHDRTFVVYFARQTTPGTYTLQVGPGVLDQAGHHLAPYQASYRLPAPPSGGGTFTSADPMFIAQHGFSVSLLQVNHNVTIRHLQVRLNISYPHDWDLRIHLQAPDGTDVLLIKYAGGSRADFRNTVFDDNSGTYPLFVPAPFTGTLQSMVPLATLNGSNAHGTWKLWVENRGGSATGTLHNWSLVVNG